MGGAESLVLPFARTVDRRRLDLRVCCLKSLGGNPLEEEIREVGVSCLNLHSRGLRDLGAFRRLLRWVRSQGIGLLHAHLTDASIWGALVSRLTGIPAVATLHVVPSPASPWSRLGLRQRLMVRLLNWWSRGVIAVSQAVRDAWICHHGFRPDRLVVIHNGIDWRRYTPANPGSREQARLPLGIPLEVPVLMTATILRPGKGLDVLIRGIPLLRSRLPEVRLLIAGDGPLRESLVAQAEAEGLSPQIHWLGWRRDLPDVLPAADLFVLPSLEDAFPTVLLEAMAAGLPVVATAVGGIPEIVEPDRTGRLVPPGDAEALARAAGELLDRPEVRTAMAEAACRRVRESFSVEGWVARLEEVYTQALGEGRGR